ncbi:kinectin isoform X2 [Amia ocellicauda]|uniref:kinectin isoform X2 n=1 Tax=Amia ocellicauda TaxID=2972642 RepID=UPI003463E722
MAMELYDSQYLLILAPSLVIALMFLFFWLFMKETSYDEVLARQKRDHKPPPVRPDIRKKNDKKKSKKKEGGSGGGGGGGGSGGGGGGESDSEQREFELADAVSPSHEDEEPLPPLSGELPSGLRERKKRDRKQQATAPRSAGGDEGSAPRELNGSKPSTRKNEPSLPVTKQPSPPPADTMGKKKASQKKQKNEADDFHLESKPDPAPVPGRKEAAPPSLETKLQDGAPVKKKNAPKKQKAEPVALIEEALIQATVYIPLMDNDPVAPAAPPKGPSEDTPAKTNAKKMKNETDKENTEMKLKELLCGLRGLALSAEEAVSVAVVLRDKCPAALDAWHKSVVKSEPSAQQLLERERLLSTLQEEASIAKEQVKQLSQELMVEKQKTARVDSMLREQRGALEKDRSVLQAKAQGSMQETQAIQIKFQQLRDQLEGQVARLQQENSILRDAVSTATNQMETKQSSELNKLRLDYGQLMKELGDKNAKLQQEELQRKGLEVTYNQNVSQLESQLKEAERRWEEVEGYVRSVNTEHENLKASKKDLQNKLLAVESELNSKNKEIQTLHSSLTDTMFSKDQVEQKMMQLLEASQHSRPDDSLQDLLQENKNLNVQIESLQAQVASQATVASRMDELQKMLAEKEVQKLALEDSLKMERSSGANRETDMQAMHNENVALKTEVQKLQAQMSEQAATQHMLEQLQKSAQEKEEKIKTVEMLLEAGLIEVANKEDKLKMLRNENESLKGEMQALQQQNTEQTTSELRVEDLQKVIEERDERMKALVEQLQKEMVNVSEKQKTIETLVQQVEALKAERELVICREAEQASIKTQLQELQKLLSVKEEEMQTLQRAVQERATEAAERELQLQALREESSVLRGQMEEQQVQTSAPSQELLTALAEKDRHLAEVQSELAELRESLELHRKKNNELREKNWSAMEALSATESVLQGKLGKITKESQKTLAAVEAQSRDVLHRLFPSVPLPHKQNHQEWLQEFESAAKEVVMGTEHKDTKGLEEKLRESEEVQKILQKDCETYKKVLAETEGILQRLQNSVEQEESRWKVKLEASQNELKPMCAKVADLEREVDRLGAESGEVENLRQERQHLEAELERAERESATYVTEVRELKDLLTELQSKLDGSYTEAVRQNEELNVLKTQLNMTLSKLETEESERQKVAGDLYKAQQSLDLIQAEILKESGQMDLIENSTIATQTEEMDRKEKMAAGLNQTVKELQQLLRAVNRQLTKGQEGGEDKYPAEV